MLHAHLDVDGTRRHPTADAFDRAVQLGQPHHLIESRLAALDFAASFAGDSL